MRTHLVGSGNPAAMSVPFVYDHVKMTVLKGEDALAARRHIASKLTPSLINALQRPRRVDAEPNWAPMQQLHDAGIRRNPVTGTAVFNPENCKPSRRATYWRADGSIADSIDTKQMGQTDEALDELQMRLHEHAAQLREVAPRSRRLSRSDGTLAKRSRGASPTASLSDEATDTDADDGDTDEDIAEEDPEDEVEPWVACDYCTDESVAKADQSSTCDGVVWLCLWSCILAWWPVAEPVDSMTPLTRARPSWSCRLTCPPTASPR